MSGERAGRRVLILGGTSEARALASALDRAGVTVVSSLAGRLERPRLPAGGLRIGGFGGTDGLTRWLLEHDVVAVIDATHPFAERVSASAVAASTTTGIPLLRLERPPWTERPGDRWHRVDDLDAAADVVTRISRRAWLTIGRQGLAAFARVETCWFLIRCIESPEPPLPPEHEILLDRGPYTLEGELALIDRHRIGVLVTKESGGAPTGAKLEAARRRELPVVVVRRPSRSSVTGVPSVDEACAWALARLDSERIDSEPGGCR